MRGAHCQRRARSTDYDEKRLRKDLLINERNHFVREPAPWLGAASDVGQRHHVNQDALALGVTDRPRSAVIVVADGVTSARTSEVGAVLAASTARATLQRQLGQATPSAAVTAAFHDANYAVLSGAPDAACTLVVAVWRDGVVTVGNVGDSRAYWVPLHGATSLLTEDDSLAQVRMHMGMTRADAESGIGSHTITRWLGRSAPDVQPNVASYTPHGDGFLVVCSDGLWNYASEPDDMGALVLDRATGSSGAAALAESLVGWANDQGGRDNITVVVMAVSEHLVDSAAH